MPGQFALVHSTIVTSSPRSSTYRRKNQKLIYSTLFFKIKNQVYIPYSDILWTVNHWHFMFYFLLFSWRFFINYTRLFLILHCVYVFFGLLFPQEECICMKQTENWENRSTKQFPILKTVWGIIRIVGDPICNIITNNDYLNSHYLYLLCLYSWNWSVKLLILKTVDIVIRTMKEPFLAALRLPTSHFCHFDYRIFSLKNPVKNTEHNFKIQENF